MTGQKRLLLDRAQILDAALALLREKQNIRELNLRSLAAALGCSHANLYNYFTGADALLWAAHAALQPVLIDETDRRAAVALAAGYDGLTALFYATAELYVTCPGWFHLCWTAPLGGERPAQDIAAMHTARTRLDGQAAALLHAALPGVQGKGVTEAMHVAHCFLVGEVSNYHAGRRQIDDTDVFIETAAMRAAKLFVLWATKE